MLKWTILHPKMTHEALGLIPFWLDADDPRAAKEQLSAGYASFGGWYPINGFRMSDTGAITYPGDPPLEPLAETHLRDETIRFYRDAWVSITQPDGSFEVARMD